jgi:predicted PurR-regulated permease PerM
MSTSSELFRKGFILLLVAVAGIGFLIMIADFLTALLLAGIFAGLLYPVYTRVCAFMNGRRITAAIATLTGSFLLIGIPLFLFIGVIAHEAIQVSQDMRPWIQQHLAEAQSLSEDSSQWLPFAEKLEPYRDRIMHKVGEVASSIGRWLASNVSTVTEGTLGFLLSLFVMVYALFFFLVDGSNLIERIKAHLPLAPEDRDLVVERGLAVSKASLKGILFIGALQGFLVGIGLWACGLEGASFWGAITFILSAIPGLGAPIIWIPAAGYLIYAGDVGWGIGLIIWGILVIGLVDNVLRPYVVGRDARLSDLTILVSILGGISIFGPLGVIIGPIVAALLDTVLNIYRRAYADQLPSRSAD